MYVYQFERKSAGRKWSIKKHSLMLHVTDHDGTRTFHDCHTPMYAVRPHFLAYRCPNTYFIYCINTI